jgi:hypothetical protein
MDRTQIPPELLGLAQPVSGPVPPQIPGAGSTPLPIQGQQPLVAGSPLSPAPAPMGSSALALPAPPADAFPPPDPSLLASAEAGVTPQDPILASLLGGSPLTPVNPELMKPDYQRKGYFKLPDEGYMEECTHSDYERYRLLLERFGRDLTLYRQKHRPNVPPLFDPLKEIAFKSATISNIVNKLTNMASAGDWRHVVPFKDEKSKVNSQIAENWYSYLRQCEEEAYAIGGGDASLQWDEFFYLFQFGRVVCRILPDLDDTTHPYNESLLDPSTCFPVFGDSKNGMVRMTRRYESRVIDVIKTYGTFDPDLEEKIVAKLAYEKGEVGRYYNETGTVWEYWDTWNRGVRFKDIWLMRTEHKLGYVPFVYVTARGEPRGVVTPETEGLYVDEYGNAFSATSREDLVEKGVSVFHHIINTNKMTEVVYTLLLSEVMKAQNPAMITYSAPQMAGTSPPPVRMTPGANNQRVLNAQRVEIVPTSPRPTDTSPVLNKVSADTTEGTINPAMYGSMDGSNIAGFAVESLISAARDTILPYTQAFERYQGLKAKMRAKLYLSHISMSPGGIMSVAMEGQYGSSPSADVTPEVIKSTGPKVEVEMIGVSDSALPSMINLSAQAVKEGLWSRRKAMEKLGEKDPAKMLEDIIAERAIEHPEIMENIIIPQVFMKQGQNDLAYMWGLMVVMPKLMQTMGGLMGGMAGMPPGGGPPGAVAPPAGPQQNGMSNPMMARKPAPPTGPQPGQGRGPA